MSVGDNIRTARINKGLTQKELAEKLVECEINIGNTTISNWEKGISKPDPDTLEALCNILNVDANFILGFNNSKSNVDQKEKLRQVLVSKGIIDKNENITEENFNTLIQFIDNNKDLLIKK